MQNQKKYSFTSSIVTAVPFDIPDEKGNPLKYIFRLPSADDFTPVNQRNTEREKLQEELKNQTSDSRSEEEINKRLKELSDADDEFMNSLMVPQGHTTAFKDAIQKVPIPVAKAVNEMIEAEIGFKAA